MNDAHTHGSPMGHKSKHRPYIMLAVNLGLSLLVMYLGMFAMIYSWGEFIQNINFLYMALVMWAPMAVIMLLTMKSMYPNTRLNLILHAAFAVTFVLALVGIRTQGLVGDRAFVTSMIPHHSGAVLMCKEASLKDRELRELCYGRNGIIVSQQREIAQMKAILSRL